eukprot:82690-Rhodomonas_salina.1
MGRRIRRELAMCHTGRQSHRYSATHNNCTSSSPPSSTTKQESSGLQAHGRLQHRLHAPSAMSAPSMRTACVGEHGSICVVYLAALRGVAVQQQLRPGTTRPHFTAACS